jgi:hypothetical protein
MPAPEGLDNSARLLRSESRRFILRADAACPTRHGARNLSARVLTIPLPAAARDMEMPTE